jgi:hypothetical protein
VTKDFEEPPIPHFPLPTETLVREEDSDDPLLWFDGLLPLPIGSRINLDNAGDLPRVPLDRERFPNGHADAVVVRVGVWGTQGAGRYLVLEVRLTEPGDEGGWMLSD